MLARFGLLFYGAAVFGTGCAHHYNLPVHALDIPETRGVEGSDGSVTRRTWGRVELGFTGGTSLEPHSRDPWPRSETDELVPGRTDVNGFIGGAMALDRNLDVFLRLSTSAPILAGVKYQLTGEPESAAAQGNFSVAVRGGVGASLNVSRSGARRYGTRFFVFEGALPAGYRLGAGTLVYLSPRIGFGVASGAVELIDAESGVGDPAPFTGDVSGSILQYGVALGTQVDWADLLFRFEVAWAKAPAGGDSLAGWFPALSAGFRF